MYKIVDATTGRLVGYVVAKSGRAAKRYINNSRMYNRFNIYINVETNLVY